MLQITVIGHLGRDAEVREVNGQKAISFSVAHSHYYYDANGQRVEKTSWVRCTLWREKDGISQYLKKGTLVMAQGMPKVHVYVHAESRQPVGQLEMRVTDLQLLGGKKEDSTAAGVGAPVAQQSPTPSYPAGGTSNQAPQDTNEDLPF